MTKEAILDNQVDSGTSGITRTGLMRYGRFDCRIIHASMSEYAKQQAIAFFTWYGVRMASFLEYIAKVKPICESKEIEEAMRRHEGATFEQLYAKFVKDQSIEQQNKQQ